MNNDSKRLSQLERIELHRRVLEKRSGKAVRTFNQDGYVNVLNKYGTSKDTSEHYHYQPEPAVPDDVLSMHYESNGLFAKIIDAPAEESVKHGFELEGISDPDTQTFFREAYDTLDLDNIFVTGNKWARLFGGAIGVIIADDGRGIDEPLDWKNIKSVEEVRIYDRSLIQPDYHSMFSYSPEDPYMTRGQKFGMPERYAVFSKYGTFTVHESRCLIFRNGILPEKCTNSVYQFWGMPEYMRLKRSMRDTELAYGSGPKMLDRSVQAIYKMKGLSEVLSAEGGDDIVLKRLEVIDMARGMLNSITIDSEGEDYDFKQFQFSGVAEIIDRSCAYLSALSNIPQSILFGAGAGGLSTTDDTSMENWYNYVERIQRNNNKANLRYLLSIIAQAGVYTGELQEVPPIKVKFNPLWSQSETEKVDIEQKRAGVQSTKAQTAAAYVQMGAIDPSEVRRKLADDEEFNVETILDDLDENDLLAAVEGAVNEEGEKLADELGGNSPDADPAATKSEEELNGEDLEQMAEAKQNADDKDDDMARGVGVLVVKDGKVLVGVRVNDFAGGLLCGPGGHAKIGETPEDAAIRETQEEFGITPTNLVFIGTGPREVDTGIASDIFLCTEYEGEIKVDKVEMAHPAFVTLDEIEEMKASLFQPFADSITILNKVIKPVEKEENDSLVIVDGKFVKNDKADDNNDGGKGSGNFGHKGVHGEVGGSAPSGSKDTPSGTSKCKKPEEFDEYVKSNGLKPLYRGFSASTDKELEDYHAQLKNGMSPDSTAGTSAFGSGIYFSDNPEEAEQYVTRRKGEQGQGSGKVATCALDKDAKVVDMADVEKEHQEAIEASSAEIKKRRKEGAPDDEIEALYDARDRLYSMKSADYARHVGYDAVYDKFTGYTVVVNQNALLVRDDSEDEINSIISEKPIDKSAKTDIIKSKDNQEDGAPEGNSNASGPHKRSKMSKTDKAKYRKRLVGQKTSDGVEIKSVSNHALDRAAQRNISPKQIEAMMSSDRVSKDKEHPDTRRCYDIKSKRMVVDFTTGEIVTVEKRRQNK